MELNNKEEYLHPKAVVIEVLTEMCLAGSPMETIEDDSQEHSWT